MRRDALVVGLILAAAGVASAQSRKAEVAATVDGDPVYRVLPVGAIPAIDEPTFVSGDAAEAQMQADEAILGLVIAGEARAYSLWQLDAHEIVNDRVAGTAIAATW